MDNQQKTPQQLRAERQKYIRIQRTIRIVLILAALILSIISLTQSCSTKKAIDDLAAQLRAKKMAEATAAFQNTENVSALEGDTAPSETPVTGDQTVTISFVGDCTLATDNATAEGSFEEYYENEGAGYFFKNVKSILEGDDLTVANLESVFTETDERNGSLYAYKSEPSHVTILAEGNINAVNLANSHSQDYGPAGYVDTIAHLNNAGLGRFGGTDALLMTVNSVKVGLIGLSTYENSNEQIVTMTKEQIEELKKQGAQVIVAEYHWGEEGSDAPTEDQIQLAHSAVDAGADVVIGHHPRILQGVEIYNGKYIAYSLGTFCYGGTQPPEDFDTMIFQQTFTLKDGAVEGEAALNMIPCSMSSQASRNDYCPTPADEQNSQRILDKIYSLSGAVDGGIYREE